MSQAPDYEKNKWSYVHGFVQEMCQFVSGFSSTDQYAMLPQQIVLLRYDRMTKRQHGLYCCVGKNIEQERNAPGLLSNINTCLTSRIQFVSLSTTRHRFLEHGQWKNRPDQYPIATPW